MAGAGAGEIFLRGLFDKVHAVPQMAKRAEYKSAADMYMEKTMTDPDREQLTAVMQSWYDAALAEVAARPPSRPRSECSAAFEASPQFAEDAKAKGLMDRIGYDDDALARGAGPGRRRRQADQDHRLHQDPRCQRRAIGANIAVIEAAGEIVDGTASGSLFNTSAGIASDDLSEAIRQATRDTDIKAIVLRVDSPGGSVTASDQILDAVKKAQAKGKPVVVSMGGAGGVGRLLHLRQRRQDRRRARHADRLDRRPDRQGQSVGKSLDMVGVKLDEVAIGKNTLMDSPVQPYTAGPMGGAESRSRRDL